MGGGVIIRWGVGQGDTLPSIQGLIEIVKDEKELVMGRLGGGGQNVPEERTSRTQVVRRGEVVGQSGSCGPQVWSSDFLLHVMGALGGGEHKTLSEIVQRPPHPPK